MPRRVGVTWLGDTGLWFTPTATALAHGRIALSGQRVNGGREPGFSDISHGIVTGAIGLGGRTEIFGSMRLLTRIDRDSRPVFSDVPRIGGPLNEYPFVVSPFTGNALGDATVGSKVVLVPQTRLGFSALAIRGMVKLPLGDRAVGVSTGKVDLSVDAILSQIGETVEFATAVGYVHRGDPQGIDLSDGVQWSIGASGPLASPFQVVVELRGEAYLNDTVVLATPLTAARSVTSLGEYELRNWIEAFLGGQWSNPNGFFVSAGATWNALHRTRAANPQGKGVTRDGVGLLFRVGFLH